MKHLMIIAAMLLVFTSCEKDPVEPDPIPDRDTIYEMMEGSWVSTLSTSDSLVIVSEATLSLYWLGKAWNQMACRALNDTLYWKGQKWITQFDYSQVDVIISLTDPWTILAQFTLLTWDGNVPYFNPDTHDYQYKKELELKFKKK